jgi:hypothetical protein
MYARPGLAVLADVLVGASLRQRRPEGDKEETNAGV